MAPTKTRTKVEPGIYLTPSSTYLVRTPQQRGSTKTVDATFERLADARAFKASAAAARAAGDIVRAPQRGTRTHVPTFEAYVASWLEQRRRKTAVAAPEAFRGRRGVVAREQTLDGYESMLRRLTVPLQKQLLNEIDRSTVEDLAIWLAAEGYAESTANEALRLLVSIFETVPERYMPGRNPARGVKPVSSATPKTARATSRARALTLEEVKRWADCVPAHHQAALWLAAIAGLRCGEICGLKVKELNLEAGTLSVVRQRRCPGNRILELEYTKTGASRRTLPLPPSLVAYLRWYIEIFQGIDPTDPAHQERYMVVGLKRGADGFYKEVHPGSISAVLATGRKAARLDRSDLGWKPSLHWLRKCLGAWLEASGQVTGRLVSDYLGHENLSPLGALEDRAADVTLDVYTPTMGDVARLDAVAAVTEHLVVASGIELVPGGDARVSVAEAAVQLGLTPDAVLWLIRTGVLEAVKARPPEHPYPQWRIDADSLRAELARRAA